ncbi:MAG: 3-phosphoshikimate 1-carboxyvinyltransferase [Acidobacteriota bacterium]|nr:3-phosphoshikimate 1-carboxyvinyltransferase [Acidobacteriota bacterium]MDE3043798.1 3-phosphoshikimate 1-carboxyvinyltransferase [Acidobacteriota bacterium]MDE3106692.1 3-phosphoshikimate 1-carboxyvinyltransferase [Acidobacteriota bacterium]MDE3223236.1 3-phosphoshikimate 1-carboxyvinyltransferase [Acidobacteriota bacterium]
MMDRQRVEAVEHLRGTVRVPGDKSISHRALLLSALASGVSVISGLSSGHDVAATRVIVSQLGAELRDEDGDVVVEGARDGLRVSAGKLDCQNSGTTMRLLCGVLAGVPGEHHLVGDASLSRRPMDRVAMPLELMGARLEGQGERRTAPLRLWGSTPLQGIDYAVPEPSAQVKSAILLAGLAANGACVVREAIRTRSATEDMLRACGVTVTSESVGAGRVVELTPSRPTSHHWRVPGDPSQAAFFAVLAAIHDDASLDVLSLDASPERVGFVFVLQRMGARVDLVEHGGAIGLRAETSMLHATEIHAHEIPSVDEVPILSVAAAAASGVSVFREMSELRVKESDRLEGSARLVNALGARAWIEGDDLYVEGLGSARRFRDFSFDAALDHRMVMSAAIAGCAGHGVTIDGAATVASSYPTFFRDLALLS